MMPDTTVIMKTDGGRILRFYVCLGSLKEGFRLACRPLIGLDACFLKGPYGGQLMSVVGIDPNNEMYPFAWAMVEAENAESWSWFLQLLIEDIEIINDGGWTFISNKQKGLVQSLRRLVPNAERRHCVMHLYEVFSKKHKRIYLRSLFWSCEKATNTYMFDKNMTNVKKADKDAHDWLSRRSPSEWSLSHFRILVKSDMYVNYHCEVFNSKILKAREQPIVTMLEGVREYCMNRIVARRNLMERHEGVLPPRILERLEILKSRACGIPSWSGGSTWSVQMTSGGHKFVVDMVAHSCTCRRCDLCGILCEHAIACINKKGCDIKKFVHACYSKEMHMKLYSFNIEALRDYREWDDQGLEPPLPPDKKNSNWRTKER